MRHRLIFFSFFSFLLPLSLMGQSKGLAKQIYVFMAPECPICQYYTPLLRSTREQLAPFSTPLTLAFTTGDSLSVIAFERKYQTGWKLIWGEEARNLAKQFGASVTPELLALDSQNQMLYRGRINDAYVAPGKRRPIIRLCEIDSLTQSVIQRKVRAIASQPAIGCLMNP